MNPTAKGFLSIGGVHAESLAANIGVTLTSILGGLVPGVLGLGILITGVIILIATKPKRTPPPTAE